MEISGHNDTEQLKAAASFVLPSWSEVFLLAILSTVVLLVANSQRIWLAFSDSSRLGAQTASDTLQPRIDYINNIFQKDLFGQLAVIVAWCVVGCLAYMAIWSLQRFLRRVKDDMHESGYTTPVKSKSYWAVRTGQYIYFICTAFLFLLFLVAFLVFILPMASGMAEATIQGRLYLSSYLYLLMGIGLVMLSLYCLTRLWRGARYAFKSTFNSLD